MSSRLIPLLAAGALSVVFGADSGRTQSPVLGWVSVGHAELRAVTGVPGAVALGAGVALPDGSGKVVIAPGQRLALIESATGKESMAARLTDAGIQPVSPVAGSLAQWDRAVFSSSGDIAALVSGSRLQLIGGLNSEPQVRMTVSLEAKVDGPVTALAVSNDGRAAVGTSDGTSGSVWIISDGETTRVAAASVPTALLFLDSGEIVVGDSGSKRVSVAGKELRLIVGEAEGIVAPADIQVAAGGKIFWIADSGANTVWTVDTAAGTTTRASSPYAPGTLTAVPGGAFLISSRDGEQAGIWNPRTVDSAVWWLPVTSPAAEQGNR